MTLFIIKLQVKLLIDSSIRAKFIKETIFPRKGKNRLNSLT